MRKFKAPYGLGGGGVGLGGGVGGGLLLFPLPGRLPLAFPGKLGSFRNAGGPPSWLPAPAFVFQAAHGEQKTLVSRHENTNNELRVATHTWCILSGYSAFTITPRTRRCEKFHRLATTTPSLTHTSASGILRTSSVGTREASTSDQLCLRRTRPWEG